MISQLTISKCKRKCEPLFLIFYNLYSKYKIRTFRRKDKIEVLFVLHELSTWKSELLYLAMFEHPRFKPIIGLTWGVENDFPISNKKYCELKNYLLKKGYPFIELDNGGVKLNPDIIFYIKPYDNIIKPNQFFTKYLRSVFAYIPYSFTNVVSESIFFPRFFKYCSWIFVENESVKDEMRNLKGLSKRNILATNLPLSDTLLSEPGENGWKTQQKNKKKIIYAPHWTIPIENEKLILSQSTFLDYCDFMIEMAEKYSEETQWLFKPHPLLQSRLKKIWSNTKVESYYQKWATLENSQLEEGMYYDFFKHSDAMIHDSSSFTVEYMYTKKPVMFLNNDWEMEEVLSKYTDQAYRLHYQGNSQDDIEKFIRNVVKGKDEMLPQREKFFDECLLPPNGKSACENIIEAILGTWEK